MNTQKLIDVSVIDCLEEAETIFRTNNDMDIDECVFIPEIIERDGQLYAQGLNTCFGEVDESIEQYINEYDL